LQRVMDWIRTMAESLSMEEEDGKLCTREQMSRHSQLTATFPSLLIHTNLEKVSCMALGVFTPDAAYTVNVKGGPGPLVRRHVSTN
jgi:hypothetical protein